MSYKLRTVCGGEMARDIIAALGRDLLYDDKGYVADGTTIISADDKAYTMNAVDWAKLYGEAFFKTEGEGKSPLERMCDELEVRAQQFPKVNQPQVPQKSR